VKVQVLNEEGINEAMLGLSLSYNQPFEEMMSVAERLALMDGGHNKFLESIAVWIDITAARYWWQQFDTYRVGVTKQSESTMHTITRRPLVQADFQKPISGELLGALNELIISKDFASIKNLLPEGFLQRRIVCTNYKALRHIYQQRKNHRLPEWNVFFYHVTRQVDYPRWITE